ncbi:MAG TPA: helix-turn-helix domain-containing protein, partial [Streptosporangiaceae bacterium]|nr:helix-turn-helix domain-containing protein [Streptosporangiaceae bacterium]
MAYAEKVPSPKGDYWRGRYKDAAGRWVSVRDANGGVVRFAKQIEAERAAEDRESDVRNKRAPVGAERGDVTFEAWANDWYAGLDLAASTMANRRRHLQDHLLPYFGAELLPAVDAAMIGRWERHERAEGASRVSIATWRGTLHTCLEDAVPRHLEVNPARQKANRGKRAGKGKGRGPEKPFATPLEVLLIAERMSVLTGRDDEFVMAETAFWAALRLGETVGLEREFLRPKGLRVESQVYEVELPPGGDLSEEAQALRAEAPGGLLRCPPKDDSYGDVILAPFMTRMLRGFASSRPAAPCPCHGKAYVFRGLGRPRGARRPAGAVTAAEVAAIAGVSQTTVSNVLTGHGGTSEATRRRVEEVAAAAGYVRHRAAADPAWHWRRSSFEGLFSAAASALLPPKAPMPQRPVPLAGEWPGTRVRGRNAQGRAEWCWMPLVPDLTPHLLRHSVKTLMEEKRIPEIMSETQLRHDIPGV